MANLWLNCFSIEFFRSRNSFDVFLWLNFFVDFCLFRNVVCIPFLSFRDASCDEEDCDLSFLPVEFCLIKKIYINGGFWENFIRKEILKI